MKNKNASDEESPLDEDFLKQIDEELEQMKGGKKQLSSDVFWLDLITDILQLIPCLIMISVYATYCYWMMRKYQLSVLKTCVSNYRDFHPYEYTSGVELDEILAQQGSVNVTKNFTTVLFFGFFVNAAMIFYFMMKRICFDPRNSPKCLLYCMYGASLVQFIWMIIARSSHPGRVCSGDFDEFLSQSREKTFQGGQFDDYYHKSEGYFFFAYIITMLVLTLSLFVIIPIFSLIFYKLKNKSIDRPIVWAAHNSSNLLSWSKKEGRKIWVEVKEKAEENKEEFMKQAQNLFQEAMSQGNWDEYIMELAEQNPELAKKMAQYHNSDMADMINNPDKYIQELKDQNPEMAKKFQEMNASRKAKLEELYEQNPEMREMVNEAKFQFEESTHLSENLGRVSDTMHRLSEHGRKVQSKNQKLQEHSKQFDEKYASKIDKNKDGSMADIEASNVTNETRDDENKNNYAIN